MIVFDEFFWGFLGNDSWFEDVVFFERYYRKGYFFGIFKEFEGGI